MRKAELIAQIIKKGTFLCVGLDTDINKIPGYLKNSPDPVFEFNKAIIDATLEHCVAYKPNLAFYESMGPKGLESLKKTIEYLPKSHFTIADAKRGDIGNTSAMYARTFFDFYGFDSVTVAPYMGEDSVRPFLGHEGKWVIVLGLTSNEGSRDFQSIELKDGEKLFERVLSKVKEWGSSEELMVVAGATQGNNLKRIRNILPDYFLLVPGLGAQGGDLNSVCKNAMTKDCGLLVNASRSILYASSGVDFALKAKQEASLIHQQMRKELSIL